MTVPFMTVNGLSMYYELHGSGQPLVLIGGFTADHLPWMSVVPQLAEHYQVLLFNNRGAGRSESPDEPYTLEQMAADVMGLVAALGLNSPHIVGHSMGGMIAQWIARRYAASVRSVTICNSAMYSPALFADFAKLHLRLRQAGEPARRLIMLCLPWIFSTAFLARDEQMSALIELSCQNPYPQTEVGHRRQLEAILNFNSADWLSEITIPVNIVATNEDLVTPLQCSEELRQSLPVKHYACFKQTGHMSYLEQPQLFIEFIRASCSAVPAVK